MSKMYINGRCVEGKGEPFDVINPATGEVVETLRACSIEQAEEALKAAGTAFKTWSRTSINERVEWMLKLEAELMKEEDSIIDLLQREGGKNINEATNDFHLFFTYLHYYAEEVKRVYDMGIPNANGYRDTHHTIIRRPRGVIVAHLAWNVPMVGLGQKMNPLMASGCTGIIRPSTATPLATLKFGEACERIGLPAGVVNILTGPANEIGTYLTKSEIPATLTVIGSSAVGLQTIRDGATAVKHYSMELGGNAPVIIMPDYEDLDEVVNWIAHRKVQNAGQGCANVNRIYVHEDIHDVFVEKLVAEMKTVPVGWDKEKMPNAMGALIDVKTRDQKLAIIQDAIDKGAKLLYGGTIPTSLPDNLKKGAFMLPTVLDEVTDDMYAAREELFAPICAVLTFSDVDDVIRRANDTVYGLNSYVFTHNSQMIGKFIEDLEFGEVEINLPNTGVANPAMPQVGLKNSGVGCDRSLFSLDDYYNIRGISVRF